MIASYPFDKDTSGVPDIVMKAPYLIWALTGIFVAGMTLVVYRFQFTNEDKKKLVGESPRV